ncbi:DNA-binding transcription factor [Apophysomyces sp. BC1034]|nr:DNA-binding transcription factor [Apophysomyces sp. BC1034]
MLPWQAAPALYANTDCCTALGATPTITQDGTSLFCTFPTTEPVPPLSPAATTYAAPYYGSAWPCDDTSNTSIIASSSSTTSTSPSPIMYPATPPPTTPAVPSSLLPSAPRRKKETSGAPYTCVECNKQFTRPYNLKSHMRTHTNERPFVCKHPNCTWKFARPHDLKRHELLHSGHKPHACPVCPKRFARCDALKRHWKVDAGCAQRMEAFYHLTQRKYRKRM